MTLDLRQAEGQELFHQLLDVSDVLVVGNRPSALQRWGIDYESVHAAHPHVVMLHITGYGKGGPKSDRPGYGTLAEAMSGFAHVTGQPDGPPTLPPFMLADGVASLAATYAVMMALYHRDVHGGGGQLVDVNLIEPLARLIESSTLAFDQLGVVPRAGRQPPRRQRAPQRLPHRRRQVAGHLQRVAEHRRAGVPRHRPCRPGRGPRLRRPDPPAGARRPRSTTWWPSGSCERTLGRGDGRLRGGRGHRRPGLRRRAAAGRRAPAGPWHLRPRRRRRLRPGHRAGAGRPAERDAGAGRPPRSGARRRQRRRLRRACSASTPPGWPRLRAAAVI